MIPHSTKIFRFLLVGGSAAMVDFSVFLVCLALLNMASHTLTSALPFYPEQLANGAGILCGFFLSFILNRVWSFRSTGNPYLQLAKSIALVIINAIISGYCISFLSRDVGLDVKIAKIMMQVLVAGWNYLIFNYLIYHSKH